ncbi:hypothetical protein D3C73_1315120 [compost metagenome]
MIHLDNNKYGMIAYGSGHGNTMYELDKRMVASRKTNEVSWSVTYLAEVDAETIHRRLKNMMKGM